MKRYSKIMLPQKMAPHVLTRHPEIRHNIDLIITQNKIGMDIVHSVDVVESESWKYALDLFNHGYYWETHGVLELIWNALKKGSEDASFIQGFIQISACLLKYREKEKRGCAMLLESSTKSFNHEARFGIKSDKLLKEVKLLVKGKTQKWPKIDIV